MIDIDMMSHAKESLEEFHLLRAELLSDVEGMQNVGMRPGESLGRDLGAVDFVNLLVDVTTLCLDV